MRDFDKKNTAKVCPIAVVVSLLALLLAYQPLAVQGRQFPADPIRMVEGPYAQTGTGWVLSDEGRLFFRYGESIKMADGSGAPVDILTPDMEFEVNGVDYTFVQLGTYSQTALFYIFFSNQILVRALIFETLTGLHHHAFLLVSHDGTVTNIMKRSEMGPDVDPNSPFGICSACRKVTGERPQTIVSCIVPAVADEPEVEERRSLATFFVLEEDEEPHPAIVYPMPEEELAHPANIHLNNSTTAGFVSHPYDVVIFEASMKSPRGHNVISRRYSWGGITEMPAPPEVKSTIEVEQSPTSLRIGGDQEYDDDPVIGWNFRYKLDIKTDTWVQFTRLQIENPDTGEPDIGFSVDMATGPVDGDESSDCDCALVAAHPGGEDGIREDFALCMGKPVSHSSRCERVNFSGGDTITSADTRCLGICGWTLKEGEFPIQQNIRFRFTRSGEPLPLHEDLNLVSFRSMVATGNGRAAFGLVGDGGTDVLYIYNNGELLSVMRRGDDFGDGEIGGVAGTGSLSNFNRHGQVAVRLHAPPGSTGNWVYLLSDAVSPVPDPSGYSDMWIITSD